jgi:hypothetical protein
MTHLQELLTRRREATCLIRICFKALVFELNLNFVHYLTRKGESATVSLCSMRRIVTESSVLHGRVSCPSVGLSVRSNNVTFFSGLQERDTRVYIGRHAECSLEFILKPCYCLCSYPKAVLD